MGGVRKKKSPQKIFAKIFEVKNWKLFLVVILLGFLAATQLRIDHLRMMDLKQAVFKADESQDDEKIAKALITLGKDDLKELISEEEGIEVKCHFCNSAYKFTSEELKALLPGAEE